MHKGRATGPCALEPRTTSKKASLIAQAGLIVFKAQWSG